MNQPRWDCKCLGHAVSCKRCRALFDWPKLEQLSHELGEFPARKKDKQIKNRAKNSLKRWDAFNKGPSMYYVITYKGGEGQKRANAAGHCLIGQSSRRSPINSENFLQKKR